MVPVEYERREVSEDCNLAVLAGMQVVPLKPWMEPQEMALRVARQAAGTKSSRSSRCDVLIRGGTRQFRTE